jgi:hypothetical protein
MGDDTDDTLTIAVEAARDAIDARRAAPEKPPSTPSGPLALLAGMDKGTLTVLAAFIGVQRHHREGVGGPSADLCARADPRRGRGAAAADQG